MQHAAMTTEQQRKANVRLALILASLAALFLAGFVVKILLMGG
jgi:hypothetical protein